MMKSNVLFIPHGGGPLPLFADPAHTYLTQFLKNIANEIGQPKAIIVFSAHWEEKQVSISNCQKPTLLYDYTGFAKEAYCIEYPAPSDEALSCKIQKLLIDNDIPAVLDDTRGFDHGVFVPLKLMYPKGNIPVVQVSLNQNLDPLQHIKMGEALAPLLAENVLILGSGLSFHNMSAFFKPTKQDSGNIAFEQWLHDTCCKADYDYSECKKQLIAWQNAPSARYCHPREEHLLPLFMCVGLKKTVAKRVFYHRVLNKQVSAYLW